MNIPRWQVYDSLVVSILTIYTFFVLSFMDFVLGGLIDGYKTTGSVWLGALIFFVVVHVFAFLFQPIRRKEYRIFYISGLSVFFPLVLLTSIFRYSFDLSSNQFIAYSEYYCVNDLVTKGLCGEAFSYAVFSMTIRALPVVITIPLLYRWFYRNQSVANHLND